MNAAEQALSISRDDQTRSGSQRERALSTIIVFQHQSMLVAQNQGGHEDEG
jgi:hypothetical protein